MTPEGRVWRKVHDRMRARLMLRRVENVIRQGDPDIWYGTKANTYAVPVSGWIELKKVAAWPKKEDTPLMIDTLSPQQRVSLRNLTTNGHRAYLWCFVGRGGSFLMDGLTAANQLAVKAKHRTDHHAGDSVGLTKAGIMERSLGFWEHATCFETAALLLTGAIEEQPKVQRMSGGSLRSDLPDDSLPPHYRKGAK